MEITDTEGTRTDAHIAADLLKKAVTAWQVFAYTDGPHEAYTEARTNLAVFHGITADEAQDMILAAGAVRNDWRDDPTYNDEPLADADLFGTGS